MNSSQRFFFHKYAALIFFSILVLASCKQKENPKYLAPDTPNVFQWEYVGAESQGVSLARLDKMKDTLAKKGTQKLLIIKNDKVIYEWFTSGWEDSVKIHYAASLAKIIVGGVKMKQAVICFFQATTVFQ